VSSVNGKRDFSTAFGTGSTLNVFDYFISNRAAAEWERGTGHMSGSTTLVRDTVNASSNSNALVNFSAGIKDVVNDIPAGSQILVSDTGPAGYSLLAGIAKHEVRAALGYAENRVTLSVNLKNYIANCEDLYPGAIHYGLVGTGTTRLDVAALRYYVPVMIVNESSFGGTVIVDCGSEAYFIGPGISPSNITTTALEIDAGDFAVVMRTGGNRINVQRQLGWGYWATGTNYKYKRRVDGTYDVVYTRPAGTTISAGATSTSNSIASTISLDAAEVIAISWQPDSGAGAAPLDLVPQVVSKGTPHGLNAYQFGIRNPNASVTAHAIRVEFAGATRVATLAQMARPVHVLVVGQSYGLEGYRASSYYPFCEVVRKQIDASPASVAATLGVSVSAGDVLQFRNRCIGGSAILQAHAGSAGYFVADDLVTAGPLLTTALSAISGYAVKPQIMLYSHGQQDARTITTEAQSISAQTAMEDVLWPQIRTALNSGTPAAVPIFVDMIGPRYASDEIAEYWMRDRLIESIDAGTNVHRGAETYGCQLDATVHPTEAGYQLMGAHAGRHVNAWIVDGVTSLRGPSIASAVRTGNNVAVTITVPATKTLVKPTAPDFFGLFDGSDNRIAITGYSWVGNVVTLTAASTPSKLRYPCRPIGSADSRTIDIDNIIRLTDPSDPVYAGEPGLLLESTVTLAL
jgi:hypothetical protein